MPEHPNVTAALAAVMAELPAIGKDGTAPASQGGYRYRGIEQITMHVQALFAKHGIVMAPRVEHHEVVNITVAGKPWTDTRLLVAYDVYGPGGADDKITVGPIYAIGRDNSDKGANKCMTQAFKYALVQLLCISDGKDDADGTTTEADAPDQHTVEQLAGIRQVARTAQVRDPERGKQLVREFKEQFGTLDQLQPDSVPGAWAWWAAELAIEPHAFTGDPAAPSICTPCGTYLSAPWHAVRLASAPDQGSTPVADAPQPYDGDGPGADERDDPQPTPEPDIDPEVVLAAVNGLKAADGTLDRMLQHYELGTTGPVAARRQRLGHHMLTNGIQVLPDLGLPPGAEPQQQALG